MFKLMCLLLVGFAALQATTEGFPEQVSFSHDGRDYDLTITGVATRKKFFIKVYNVASYLQNEAFEKGDLLNEILSDEWAKQLTLAWVHDADLKRVKDGYLDSFQNALGQGFSELQPDIEHFLSLFAEDVQKGDTHVLRWSPGGNIVFIINDQVVGNFSNPQFAKALWSLWFGSKSFVNRDSLLSLTQEEG